MKCIRPEIPESFDWLLAILITILDVVIFITALILVKQAKKMLQAHLNRKGVKIGNRNFNSKQSEKNKLS